MMVTKDLSLHERISLEFNTATIHLPLLLAYNMRGFDATVFLVRKDIGAWSLTREKKGGWKS